MLLLEGRLVIANEKNLFTNSITITPCSGKIHRYFAILKANLGTTSKITHNGYLHSGQLTTNCLTFPHNLLLIMCNILFETMPNASKVIAIMVMLIATSCSNKEELTGKTKKGDLKSPCVGSYGSPCSHRINPNIINIQSKDLIS